MQKALDKLLVQRTHRLAACIAALLIVFSFFFPLWGFSIFAPQYPEGLYMTIWTHKLGGDIRNVNILNHYVGMKAIDERDFPELVVAPLALATFALVSLALAIWPIIKLFQIWVLSFLVGGALGLWDMARWGYQFGTQLNPDAPIKFPGMHFVPPLIGKKTMLNITSFSYPHAGGVALTIALFFMVIVSLSPFIKKKINLRPLAFVPFFFLFFTGCIFDEKPEPIVFGSDACAACRMTISDPRFGGEIILKGGKIQKFDALDCLKSFYKNNEAKVSKVYLIDFFEPSTFILSEEASFVLSKDIRGPMGQMILVSKNKTKLKEYGAALLTWKDILTQTTDSPPHHHQ